MGFSLWSSKTPAAAIPGLKSVPYPVETTVSKFDMTFTGRDTGQLIYFDVEYSTTLFKKETVEMVVNNFKKILTVVSKNKDIKMKDIKISHDFRAAKSNYPPIEFGF